MDVGEVYKSNYWGDMVVIACHKRYITVKFVNTDNEYIAQKDAVLKGLVKDIVEQKANTAQKKIDKINECKRIKEQVHLLRKESAEKDMVAKQEQKKLSLEKKQCEIKSKVYTTKEFGDYQISEILGNKKFEITFRDTGNKYLYGIQAIKNECVIDKNKYTSEEWLARSKEKSAKHYLLNREYLLAKAKQYQKDNPERCRTYNRTRRALRMKSNGTHTEYDTMLILLEQGNKCAGCDVTLDNSKHLDHFIALANGGTNDPDNLQWLCQFCNNSKSNKCPMVWLAQISTKDYKDRKEAARFAYCNDLALNSPS